MTGEKTEEATPKKKKKAREDGQVARSAEFTGMAVMIVACAALIATGAAMGQRLIAFFFQAIEVATRPHLDSAAVGPFLLETLLLLGLMMGPLLGATVVIAALVAYLQVGPLLSIKPLIPDLTRLNIANGFKELVAPAKLVELAKNSAKLTIMGVVGALVLRQALPAMAATPRAHLIDAVVALARVALTLSLFLIAGLVLFGIIDLIWQRYRHAKKLRMSKDEIKREYKQSEGDPMLKQKRKQIHREMLQDSGGVGQVRDADAVVVNPTHVAVALRYRAQEMSAPTIVACGRGPIARTIKQHARRHQIPIVHNVDLARALVDCGLESQIPPEFFDPVAEILHHVYQLADDPSPTDTPTEPS